MSSFLCFTAACRLAKINLIMWFHTSSTNHLSMQTVCTSSSCAICQTLHCNSWLASVHVDCYNCSRINEVRRLLVIKCVYMLCSFGTSTKAPGPVMLSFHYCYSTFLLNRILINTTDNNYK